MDSISNKIEFVFKNLRSDIVNPIEEWQLLIGIVAEFIILIDGVQFYKEEEFPIFEFVFQALHWSNSPQGSFKYKSMESADEFLVAFEKDDNARYEIQVKYPEFMSTRKFSRKIISNAINKFHGHLLQAARDQKLGISLQSFLERVHKI